MGVCVPTAAAIAYQARMLVRFPLLRPIGICSCRDIAGTNTWSDHAYGNAVDLAPPSKDYGDRAYAYILANQSSLGVRYACWYGQGGCTTDHTDHIHASVGGACSGTPPCAGGTGNCKGGTVPASQASRSSGGLWGGFFGNLGSYLKVAAGGAVVVAAVAVLVVGATGGGPARGLVR